MGLERWVATLHPTSLRGETGWRLSSITKDKWFNQSCLHNEASIKTQKDRVWRSPRLVNMWRCGVSCGHRRRHRISMLLPHTLPCASLPSGCSWVLSIYDKPVLQKNTMHIHTITQNAHSTDNQLDNWHLKCVCVWWGDRQFCRTEPLTCGIWCYLQVDTVRIKLNCTTPSWCLRIVWWCGKPSHTSELVTRILRPKR